MMGLGSDAVRVKVLRRWRRRAGVGLLLACGCGVGWGQLKVSRQEFAAEVGRLEQVAAACRAAAAGCDASKLAAMAQDVGPMAAAPGFTEHWDWLRDALVDAAKAKPADREAEMAAAEGRLQEIARESAPAVAATGLAADLGYGRARAESNRILAGSEFQEAQGPSWWDRKMAQFWSWVGRLFSGVDALSEAAPWLGKLLEWVFFLAAAVGLLVFVRRQLARQRLAISLGGQAAAAGGWDREANDWATMAESFAAQQDWREAVHCLYWAAIVRLEAKRAWRHNPSRTPREYVRLLKPGSAQQGALRGLTQILERVWYGLREADVADYERARTLFAGLGEVSGEAGAGTALAGQA